MYIEKLASQIYNDVVSGLRGYHLNVSMNMEQLKDEVVACRLAIIKEYLLKGVFLIKDTLLSIDCIPVDCKPVNKCGKGCGTPHFELPQIITDFGKDAIKYIGSVDRQTQFVVITSLLELENKKYRKRGNNKPYVWIDETPNENGMLDCYIFNAPLIKKISVVAAFKDPRQLELFNDCSENEDLMGKDTNLTFIDQMVKDKLIRDKTAFYRQLAAMRLPNDLQYVTGG